MSDILAGNHWTENHPDSHFRHGIGVGLFTPDGRVSFYGGVLTQRGIKTQTQSVSGIDNVVRVLEQYFGLKLNMSAKARARFADFAG